ncbi:MAG TPA: hypothetical protein DDW52_20215 [Planctomycetaceae bacterium]|nr:hypothetical protein [Planctomycetaceae bacterium]
MNCHFYGEDETEPSATWFASTWSSNLQTANIEYLPNRQPPLCFGEVRKPLAKEATCRQLE